MTQVKPGYIYIASTAALPGLVKIGFTTQSPEKRIKQFSTGSPKPFELEFATEVIDPRRIEGLVHKYLANSRVNDRREFFKVTPKEAHEAVRSVCEEVRYREDLAIAQGKLNNQVVWFLRGLRFIPHFIRPIASRLGLPLVILFFAFGTVVEEIWFFEGVSGIGETINKFEWSHLSAIVIFPLWIPIIIIMVGIQKLIEALDFATNGQQLISLKNELAMKYKLTPDHLSLPRLS